MKNSLKVENHKKSIDLFLENKCYGNYCVKRCCCGFGGVKGEDHLMSVVRNEQTETETSCCGIREYWQFTG